MRKTRATLGSTGVFAEEAATIPAPIPKPRSPKGAVAASAVVRPDREGRKPLPFWTTDAAKRQLRIMAAEMDTTQQELMSDALNLLFQKHQKPPIA